MYFYRVIGLYENACSRIQGCSLIVFQRRNGGAHSIRAGLAAIEQRSVHGIQTAAGWRMVQSRWRALTFYG